MIRPASADWLAQTASTRSMEVASEPAQPLTTSRRLASAPATSLSSTGSTQVARCAQAVIDSEGVINVSLDESGADDDSGFYVRWRELSYEVRARWPLTPAARRVPKKRILNQLSGFFLSGELVALMGPSGAGKTTLLECLCLKNREGVTGDIMVVGKPKVRVALVPQHDEFLPQFTVTETIFYASRYKNRTYDISHGGIVRRVIQQLGLEVCQSNSINRCSGGQRKRVAIATELVKKPNILILDEPTSGLDSSSCHKTIGVLRHILDQPGAAPMSIVTTIHQPSAKVMSLFDRVYLLAAGGRPAFNGAPSEIVPLLRTLGSPCPPFYNPVEHLIELVSGDLGRDKLDRLIELERNKRVRFSSRLEAVSAQTLRKAVLFDPCPFERHLWVHVQRSTIQLLRDPILFGLRVILHLLMALFFAWLWGFEIGRGAGCPTFNKQSMSPISVALAANLTREEQLDAERVNDNLIFTVYGGMFAMYAACMITVLSFPLDVKVLAREYFNGWYSVATYLAGKITADAPFQVACVLMFAAISYHITGQPESAYHWRFMVYAYSLVCLSLLSQSQGLIVGAIFMDSLSASVFVGPLTITPVFLFSGFARRYSRTAHYLRPLVKLSYFHHAVKTIYSALYGFGRCQCQPNDYQLDLEDIDYEELASVARLPVGLPDQAIHIGRFRCDQNFQSLVMYELEIEDTDMYTGMALLLIYLLVLRALVLLLLMYKVARGR